MMFEWLFSPKEDWRLVKSLSVAVTYTHSNYGVKVSDEKGKIYYHLFESSKGKRKVEFQLTISLDEPQVERDAKGEVMYQEKVYPWLMGRVDPDIPRYSQIPEEETAVMLRGKKI